MWLVIFEKNWADEFDVHGLAILSDEQVAVLKECLPRLTYGFGTNEAWEDPGEICEEDFKFKKITEEEMVVLYESIPFYNLGEYPRFGNFPNLENVDFVYE